MRQAGLPPRWLSWLAFIAGVVTGYAGLVGVLLAHG
jgi:hypothetical protein